MSGMGTRRVCFSGARALVGSAVLLSTLPEVLHADAFDGYRLVRTFELPDGTDVFDVLTDGRLVVLVDAEVFVETTTGSRVFAFQGTLPNANLNPFAAFVRVSPDGTRIAVGDNGGGVGVFAITTLAGVWFTARHFEAEWYDNRHLALSGANADSVTLLDTASPDLSNPSNPLLIANTGVAAGITFDTKGNLFTGNGFGLGEFQTGEVRAFENAAWTAVLTGEPPLDFLADGTLVVDILSANSLGFDSEGNLHVGGGDFLGGTDVDFAALVRRSAVGAALTGGGPADPNDPVQVRRLDPDPLSDFNFYSMVHNPVTEELYVRDFGDPTVYIYSDLTNIPTVSEWGMTAMSLLMLTAGTVTIQRRQLRIVNGRLP